MSTLAAGLRAPPRALPAAEERTGLRLAAFFGLAAFAAVRYSDLLETPPVGRVVLLAALATGACALLAASAHLRLPAPLAALVRLAVLAGALALSLLVLRVPAFLLGPREWGSLTAHLSSGVSALDSWLWPYRGGERWAQTAVLLPVPVVLLGAGAVSFWPSQRLLGARRVLALGALLGLFVTGAANTPGSLPVIDGLVLLALVAATMLAPLSSASQASRALCWLAVCGVAALAVQSALGRSAPWIHYREGPASRGDTAAFQWDELYGPDTWAAGQAVVLDVAETHPSLLRVTSLDRFDGLRFLRSDAPAGAQQLDSPASQTGRWTEHAVIEVRGLRSPLLAGGGGLPTSLRPLGGAFPAPARQADGTLALTGSAPRGGAYEVDSYDPQPTAAEARRAPRTFPRAYLPYAQFELPAAGATAFAAPNLAAEAAGAPHLARLVGPSAPGRTPASNPAAAALIGASPYAPMFALARRLAAGAPSSYDVAARIAGYLHTNYAYDQHVPLSEYPLESFLLDERRGYCQQFSGAMTLMLRMEGIPARVGVGFLVGGGAPQGGTWQIRAADAHAWVEVFLSGIGWVSFDPTPPAVAATAQTESEILPRPSGREGGSRTAGPAHFGLLERRSGGLGPALPRAGGTPWEWPAAPLAVLLAVALSMLAWVRIRGTEGRLRWAWRADRPEDGAAELERALVQLGCFEPGLTLMRLQRRLATEGHVRAAGYVGALAARRFGAAVAAGDPAGGRSDLRRALRAPGLTGRLRALAALPPARRRRTG